MVEKVGRLVGVDVVLFRVEDFTKVKLISYRGIINQRDDSDISDICINLLSLA